MAAVIKAALDDLLTQLAADQDLDLDAYGAEMAAMFERAIQPGVTAGREPATG